MTVSIWVDTTPFDNPKVREALKLVVDRQAMVDTVLLGFGEAGADNPVPVGSPASYVKEAPKQDIEKAKALLAEAGYKDGLKFDLYTAEGVPGMVRMAQVYAEMAKAAGIDINVIVTPAESFWDDVWLKKPVVTSAWSMRPPGEGLAVAYTQTAKWKETHWERPDYDALLLKANTTVDAAERHEAVPADGRAARQGRRPDPADVRAPGAGAAQGLRGLHAAGAELQPELRRSELQVSRLRALARIARGPFDFAADADGEPA